MSALPYLVMGIVVLMSGSLADLLRGTVGVPTGIVRKIFTCGGRFRLFVERDVAPW